MGRSAVSRLGVVVAALGLALAGAAPASAGLADPVDQWLPSSDGATWTYAWWNTAYAPEPTLEKYTVSRREGPAFRLQWTTEGLGNASSTVRSAGTIDYRRTDAGMVNLDWSSTPPPPQFPVLCASASNCANSMASTHYLLIWGTRSPTLLEPLVRQARWNSLGGADNDVSSANRYVRRERIRVPAFPDGVTAAKVESDVTQAGALGDPYGSGVRTVWWVRGVGPVRIRFEHASGEVSDAFLQSTNLTPRAALSDSNWLPLNRGDRMRFRWRNSRHMRRWSRQQFTVSEVVNNTARVDVEALSGPIRVAGAYVFATRLSGITNLSGFTRAASRAGFPPLGPRSQPRDRRRRFMTPFDLMVFGFNPVLPAHAERRDQWRSSRDSRDYRIFGVTGRTKVLGTRSVRTPAGRYRALAVQSQLRQSGFRFGSGRRTSYFARGEGLVKLVFRHRDGSVSTVERLG